MNPGFEAQPQQLVPWPQAASSSDPFTRPSVINRAQDYSTVLRSSATAGADAYANAAQGMQRHAAPPNAPPNARSSATTSAPSAGAGRWGDLWLEAESLQAACCSSQTVGCGRRAAFEGRIIKASPLRACAGQLLVLALDPPNTPP